MNEQLFKALQFDLVRAEVQKRAIGQYSKEKIGDMLPHTHLETVQTRQTETKEARYILDSSQHMPFMGLTRIHHLCEQVTKGMILTPHELVECADFLRSGRMVTQFFKKNQYQTPLLYAYSQYLPDLLAIEEAVYQKISNQNVATDASRTLRKVRKQLQEVDAKRQEKLLSFMRHPKQKEMIQEPIIVQKGDHYTIPVKASYKNKIDGHIIEQSNKGQTVFVEPSQVAKLNERYVLLKAEEIAEEYQILAELTGMLAEKEAEITLAIETMTTFDIIFARAKYSRAINGITPQVNKQEKIVLKQGRHPLLPEDAVPLDFHLGATHRGVVITGANAGGKTVVLKTVGLLTLMTMFGLQIPAAEETQIAVLDHLFVDIGDQQNMDNALSTFSGHMQNLALILQQTKRNTLVLLDEIGSGTEPSEGAALAIAIMENLYEKGALIVATTHDGEIKRFAQIHEDFMPAAMAFDQETLTPRFVLHLGQTGDSQALWIAKKVQLAPDLIERARTYMMQKEYHTVKKVFPSATKQATVQASKPQFAKGDRVALTTNQKIGLIYEDNGEAFVTVFVEDTMQQILRQRVKLCMSAQALYPQDYDLDQLFVDFNTRKQERDLMRGSKKAHKQLNKEAKLRKLNR